MGTDDAINLLQHGLTILRARHFRHARPFPRVWGIFLARERLVDGPGPGAADVGLVVVVTDESSDDGLPGTSSLCIDGQRNGLKMVEKGCG